MTAPWINRKKRITNPKNFSCRFPNKKKTDLERAKLYLDLKKEFKKNIWWYLSRVAAAVPIATLIVTGVILYNQNKIEGQRLESEVAKQFAATIKDLDAKSKSSRLGAVLALENFIDQNEHYRSQVYLLLGAKLRDEVLGDSARDKMLVNQILETFRRVSKVRLTQNDAPMELLLEQVHLDSLNLEHFDLRSANLSEATLNGARLNYANLSGADLRRAKLSGASLNYANLKKAYLHSADLTDAKLIQADLSTAYLAGADLTAANLRSANLTSATLTSANLDSADLTQADLTNASLDKAKLIKAKLYGADLRGANLMGADLRGVILGAEDLIRARNWRSATIHSSLRKQAEVLADSLISSK